MKKRHRYIWFGVAVLIVIGVIGYRLSNRTDPAKAQRQQPVPAVKVASPSVETITASVQYTGSMTAIRQAGVYSKVVGNLENVYVNIGDVVHEGQLLAMIDTTLLAQQYAQAAATFHNAELQYQRSKDLYTQNLGSKQDEDNAEAAMLVAKANAENAATQLSYARITAPFSGVITQRFLDPGAVVTASNATLFTLMNLDSMRVLVNVLEKDIPQVTVGKEADIMVDAYPDRHFAGRVARTSDAVDPATRTLTAEIDASNRDHALKPGMFSKVTIVLGEHRNAVTVPTQAVLGDSTGSWVFTVVDNHTAHRVPVETGVQQNERTEILSGLTGEEKLIVVGQQFVKDGAPVNVEM